MYRRMFPSLWLCVLLGNWLLADPALSREAAEIPAEVPDSVRKAVNPEALTVKLGDHVLARFWLTPAATPAKTPSTQLGVQYGKIEPGSLVGVIQIVDGWSDYKKNAIRAGTYTLRYGVMPADGNHMGVSVYRDFLLLVAPAQDPGPDQTLSYDELVAASILASGVPHPAVLALFPIWDEISEPTLVKNELDQWTLAVRIGDLTFGLVVEGHGQA